jgi:MoaA/NifB/PqqE/SkfB family radical SAM enzyme
MSGLQKNKIETTFSHIPSSKGCGKPIYQYADIRSVHLELTHRCNAACPMCSRNFSGGATNPTLPLVELSLSDAKTIFPPEFVRQLNLVYACGNYGDPMVAKDCLEIFAYLRECNPELRLCMHTNGSARRPEWWADMARVMKTGSHYMRFGLDGLKDTNHLYRRRTNWEVVMENAQAFIDAGGRAEWDYLVFRHNEHQVEEARALSKEMGFKEFYVRKTGRFKSDKDLQTVNRVEVLDNAGEFDYWLEEPTNPEYLNPAFEDLDQIKQRYGTYSAYLDTVQIYCKVAEKGKVYISAEGLVLPCCWLGSIFTTKRSAQRDQFIDMIENAGGRSVLDARKHGIKGVIGGSLFQKDIPESWDKSSVADGKLATCARTCGVDFDPLGKQRD